MAKQTNSVGEATSLEPSATPSAQSLAFPLFLTPKNKWTVGVLVFAAAGFFYLTSNWFHLTPPRLLPLGWADRITPFVPWTIWIYASESLLFLATFLFLKNIQNVNKYLYAFAAVQIFSVFIFWVWPTTYPRELFPLPPDMDPASFALFNSLRGIDTPANCCPSLHVSSVFLSSFIFLRESRPKFLVFLLWSVAISISTLTTKQHYLIDILTGLVLAIASYTLFFKFVPYRLTGTADASAAR